VCLKLRIQKQLIDRYAIDVERADRPSRFKPEVILPLKLRPRRRKRIAKDPKITILILAFHWRQGMLEGDLRLLPAKIAL